jgi:hypothetical protein
MSDGARGRQSRQVEATVAPVKLTLAQANMLRNERDGRPLCAGLHGRSAHGGATWTMQSLLKRGLLIRAGGVSAAGLAALAAFDAKYNGQLDALDRRAALEPRSGEASSGSEG